jgi:hypothetical protein
MIGWLIFSLRNSERIRRYYSIISEKSNSSGVRLGPAWSHMGDTEAEDLLAELPKPDGAIHKPTTQERNRNELFFDVSNASGGE